ncbi:MAG: hypothetical protein OXQ28_15000 [Acidobacteriota bacterium]|nr:hypothetical protein [Acidobacteriota bacterium]
MKKLTLPEPAARLWVETRDVLNKLGPAQAPWRPYLGGGTIIAARIGHRESTDVDVVIRDTTSLAHLIRNDEMNLAARLDGTPIQETTTQIKVKMPNGIIDLNLAPVRPKTGAERVVITGRPQHVLSTAQILRGKLDRAARPGPVRDVYDVIRLSQDPESAGELLSAYGLLDDERKQEIEWTWPRCDEHYRDEAERYLKLTEKPCTDLSRLGSTGAHVLKAHRLARVVIELHGDRVLTERKSRGGMVFTDETHIERTRALHARNGIEETFDASGLSSRIVMQRIAICRERRRNGVIFDSEDPAPQDRFTGKNTSMKRHGSPATASS